MVDMILTIWVALIALALLGLAAFAFARNIKANVNRSFAVFTSFLALWVVANCIGSNFKTEQFAVYFSFADFFLGPILVYTFWRFTDAQLTQVRERKQARLLNDRILFVVASILALLVLTGQVVQPHLANGELVILYKPLYTSYAVIVGLIALVSVGNLLVARKLARGIQRTQILLILWAVAIAAVALLGANLLVPQLTESEQINLVFGNVSYIGLIFFIALITYAVVKHRLFDVRLVVARSIAYAMVLSVLVGLYAFFSVGISMLLPSGQHIAPAERVVYITLAILAALIFPILKKFFDRLTNRLFYRDAYDPQELFNELNKTLVTTADLTEMLNSVVEIVNKSLKAEFFTIYVMDSNGMHSSHVAGATSKKLSVEDIHIPHSKSFRTNKSDAMVIVADDLDYEDVGLHKTLVKFDIAVLIQLRNQDSRQVLGYFVLGPKKSGNPYTTRDIQAIETISNEMVIAIQNALRFEEIENFNNTLQQKINEKTKSLQLANQKLRQLDETKDDFISMASHQLRTPLTSIKGYISMVLDGDAGKITPMERKLLGQAFISSQRMVYLISDLLNVSRLRTGKFIIEPMPTNLSNIINEEVKQLQETAKGRGLELTFDKPASFETYMLDETKMRQVIMNFIDNAIYYTPSGGKIEVKLVDKPESIEFSVTDTGIGVPKEEQHKLFTKFYRAHNAKRARPDGTGLGLFMAKKVIVAQGGAVLVKSKEGKGSTFGFTFAKSKLEQVPNNK